MLLLKLPRMIWPSLRKNLKKKRVKKSIVTLRPPPVTRGATESIATSIGSFTDCHGEDLLSGGQEYERNCFYDHHTKVEYWRQ